MPIIEQAACGNSKLPVCFLFAGFEAIKIVIQRDQLFQKRACTLTQFRPENILAHRFIDHTADFTLPREIRLQFRDGRFFRPLVKVRRDRQAGGSFRLGDQIQKFCGTACHILPDVFQGAYLGMP